MIIDGKKIAGEILETLGEEIKKLSFRPLFVDVVVGEDPVVRSYVATKGKAAESLGMQFIQPQYPENTSTEDLVAKIAELNSLPNLSGLIVQLPLPAHIDKTAVLDVVDSRVDVDCLGAENNKNFYLGKSALVPPTAAAVLAVLDATGVPLLGKNIVVVGQGELVGKPVTQLLLSQGLTVNTADNTTQNLLELVKNADVVISGTGQPKLINGTMIKPGAIVIDAGTAESNGGIVGDVDHETVKDKAAYLSPVPGGVGPVTVAKLLENVVKVALGLNH